VYALPRVRAQNLSDDVYHLLRNAVLNQEITAGTRLWESDLAEELGVSRAPVREALRKLEHEGLVESFPRRGAVVVSVPEDEIRTFYELRATIEAKAFARACERATEAQLDELGEIVERMHDAYAAADVDGVLDADMRFHSQVMEISGLTILRRAWATFDGPLRLRAWQLIESAPDPRAAVVESDRYPHALLLERLRARDVDGAAAAARRHIEEIGEWFTTSQVVPAPRTYRRATGGTR
jgi:DNA-binding GntR family transcriptional regulator